MAIDPSLRLPSVGVSGHRVVGGVGVLVATGALIGAAGPAGLLLGLFVAVGWVFLPPVFAFAVAHAVLPLVAPVPLPWLVAFEVGALGVLAAPAGDDPAPQSALRAAIPLAVATLWLLAVALAVRGVTDGALWAAVAVVGAVAAAAYGLHRYALVRLGLVEEAT